MNIPWLYRISVPFITEITSSKKSHWIFVFRMKFLYFVIFQIEDIDQHGEKYTLFDNCDSFHKHFYKFYLSVYHRFQLDENFSTMFVYNTLVKFYYTDHKKVFPLL